MTYFGLFGAPGIGSMPFYRPKLLRAGPQEYVQFVPSGPFQRERGCFFTYDCGQGKVLIMDGKAISRVDIGVYLRTRVGGHNL